MIVQGVVAAFATAALLLYAPWLRGVWRRVVRVYGAYFLIAYALRGALLATFEPAPQQNQSFAIAVLAQAGYDYSLAAILPLAVGASIALYLTILAISRFAKSGELEFRVPLRVATPVVVLGTVLRVLGVIDAATLGRLGSLGQGLALGMLAGVILGTDWRRTARNWVVVLATIEVAFSFLTASKTPLLTVILLLYLDPNRKRMSLRVSLVALGGIAVAFLAVQSLKVAALETEDQSPLITLFYAVSGRLDGLYALAGAWVLGPGKYVPDQGFVGALLGGLVPGWLQDGDKSLAGIEWGTAVYGVHQGTSYAEGLAAEGFAVGGAHGPILWGFLGGLTVSLMILFASSRMLLLQMTGLIFLASTVPFERGLLGQFEQIGAAVQAAVVACVLVIVARSVGMKPTHTLELGGT